MSQDFRYQAYAGWNHTANASQVYQYFFSAENIAGLSAAITELLKSTGETIRVSDRVIGSVMSNVSANFNPRTGDIFTRYTIPTEARDDLKNMNDQVVTVIVNTIRGEYDQQCCNSKLNVWNSLLGDFNAGGLRAHSQLKTKENDYIKGVFAMNY
jgi:hypothetical protein